MNYQDWKIFNKAGSQLNLFADAYLPLTFTNIPENATGASAYAITDPSTLKISNVKVTNSGIFIHHKLK